MCRISRILTLFYFSATGSCAFFSRCIAITTTGELLFESTPLVGVQAGTPQTTSDGRYILLTHNVNQEVGHFSVLDTSAASGTAIDVVYTYVNATSPFSPIGAYHQPAEGYYDGGEGNTNDMFVWSFATARNASTVGVGQIFGFQLPMDSTAAMAAFPLGEVRDHQASTPPVLTNSGRSLYWAVTRAEQRCWVGSAFRSMYRFNRGRTSTATFARGDPAWISSRAPPSLSSDPVSPFVYGPGAAAELFRMDANFSTITTTNTSWIVSSRVAVSPDDQVIYYADQDGNVAQLDATTLETIWSTKMIAPVVSDIALNKAGTILYVGDTSGLVTALQVATSSAPTPSPSSAGTSDHPSATPTGGGAGEASSVPSISPAPAGSGGGSDGGSRPSSSGTRAPTGGNSTRNPTSGSSSLFKGSFVSAVVLGFAALIATL